MPNWLFALCSLCAAILVWLLLPRWRYWARFEIPDRALAYLAIFVGFIILCQQIADYRQGIVYMLSNMDTREIINNSPIRPSVIGIWRGAMIGLYWIFFAGGIFALVALIRGTIKDARADETNKGFQELKTSIDALPEKIAKFN